MEYNCVSLQKKARQQKEMTFQDMYESQNLLDDEDEDDSDWEPLEKHVEVMKWFCTNCTMLNFDDIDHCDVCLWFMLLSVFVLRPFYLFVVDL